MKKREWKCDHCEKVYITDSQICPKCHRVMTIQTEKNKGKKVLFS